MSNTISGEVSKKVYLLPLAVLVLCGAAFTGAVYAFDSQLTGSGDIDDVDYVTLDFDGLKGDDDKYTEYSSTTMHYKASKALTFNHVKYYDDENKEIVEQYIADQEVVLFTVIVKLVNEESEAIDNDNTMGAPTVDVTSATVEGFGLDFAIGEATPVSVGGAISAWSYTVSVKGIYNGTGVPPTDDAIDDLVVTAKSPVLGQ